MKFDQNQLSVITRQYNFCVHLLVPLYLADRDKSALVLIDLNEDLT
jgi:hypothetical protein